jgi:hypothetical protein
VAFPVFRKRRFACSRKLLILHGGISFNQVFRNQIFERMQTWMAFLLRLAVIRARAQENANKKQPAQIHPAVDPSDTAQKSATDDPNYVIGGQAILDISVWKEPELSCSVPIRRDEKISLPLLNDVQAAGLTLAQHAEQVTTSLKRFVTNLQVTTIVRQIASRRIYILGAYMLSPEWLTQLCGNYYTALLKTIMKQAM